MPASSGTAAAPGAPAASGPGPPKQGSQAARQGAEGPRAGTPDNLQQVLRAWPPSRGPVEWQILLFGLILTGFGAFTAWRGARRLRTWRAIRKTPTSLAGAIAPGPVEVAGRAEPLERGRTGRGPFSGEEAVFGTWVVEEYRSRGKRSEWVTLARGAVGGAFRVVDVTGGAVVEPEGAELDVEETWRGGSGFMKDPPPHVIEFLRARGLDFEGWFGINKRMRFRESLLREGATVYVLGTADTGPTGRTLIGLGEGFPFLVSGRPEQKAGAVQRNRGLGQFAGGVLLIGLGLWLALVLSTW